MSGNGNQTVFRIVSDFSRIHLSNIADAQYNIRPTLLHGAPFFLSVPSVNVRTWRPFVCEKTGSIQYTYGALITPRS